MKKLKLKNIYGKDVYIKLVDDQSKADFITHAGTFHADEVMSTVLLLNKFGNIKLARVNEVKNKDAFIFDIGYGKYDHHQLEFDKKRENGIKYASCGLLWDEFGCDIIEKLNISKQTVSNRENENIQPSIKKLVRLAKLFSEKN